MTGKIKLQENTYNELQAAVDSSVEVTKASPLEVQDQEMLPAVVYDISVIPLDMNRASSAPGQVDIEPSNNYPRLANIEDGAQDHVDYETIETYYRYKQAVITITTRAESDTVAAQLYQDVKRHFEAFSHSRIRGPRELLSTAWYVEVEDVDDALGSESMLPGRGDSIQLVVRYRTALEHVGDEIERIDSDLGC